MNFKKYFFVVGVLILAMMRPGLKTGVKNDFVWSEIKSGFGEQGQEFPIPTTNSQEYPLPLPLGAPLLKRKMLYSDLKELQTCTV